MYSLFDLYDYFIIDACDRLLPPHVTIAGICNLNCEEKYELLFSTLSY